MRCSSCGFEESRVVDSRSSEDNRAIRRRRECLKCGARFTTYERYSENPLVVLKSDNSTQVYDREKLIRGLIIACAKRPVSPEQINNLVDSIEAELRSMNISQISSKELGDIALKHLVKLDEVAYIRFASVYKDFKSIDEFSNALEELK